MEQLKNSHTRHERLSLSGGGRRFPPGERDPRLLSKEKRRKIEPKEIPSCLIPAYIIHIMDWVGTVSS